MVLPALAALGGAEGAAALGGLGLGIFDAFGNKGSSDVKQLPKLNRQQKQMFDILAQQAMSRLGKWVKTPKGMVFEYDPQQAPRYEMPRVAPMTQMQQGAQQMGWNAAQRQGAATQQGGPDYMKALSEYKPGNIQQTAQNLSQQRPQAPQEPYQFNQMALTGMMPRQELPEQDPQYFMKGGKKPQSYIDPYAAKATGAFKGPMSGDQMTQAMETTAQWDPKYGAVPQTGYLTPPPKGGGFNLGGAAIGGVLGGGVGALIGGNQNRGTVSQTGALGGAKNSPYYPGWQYNPYQPYAQGGNMPAQNKMPSYAQGGQMPAGNDWQQSNQWTDKTWGDSTQDNQWGGGGWADKTWGDSQQNKSPYSKWNQPGSWGSSSSRVPQMPTQNWQGFNEFKNPLRPNNYQAQQQPAYPQLSTFESQEYARQKQAMQQLLSQPNNPQFQNNPAMQYAMQMAGRQNQPFAQGGQMPGQQNRDNMSQFNMVGEQGPEMHIAQNGQRNMVGEQGPELFNPNQAGYIVPNHQLPPGLAGQGGPQANTGQERPMPPGQMPPQMPSFAGGGWIYGQNDPYTSTGWESPEFSQDLAGKKDWKYWTGQELLGPYTPTGAFEQGAGADAWAAQGNPSWGQWQGRQGTWEPNQRTDWGAQTGYGLYDNQWGVGGEGISEGMWTPGAQWDPASQSYSGGDWTWDAANQRYNTGAGIQTGTGAPTGFMSGWGQTKDPTEFELGQKMWAPGGENYAFERNPWADQPFGYQTGDWGATPDVTEQGFWATPEGGGLTGQEQNLGNRGMVWNAGAPGGGRWEMPVNPNTYDPNNIPGWEYNQSMGMWMPAEGNRAGWDPSTFVGPPKPPAVAPGDETGTGVEDIPDDTTSGDALTMWDMYKPGTMDEGQFPAEAYADWWAREYPDVWAANQALVNSNPTFGYDSQTAYDNYKRDILDPALASVAGQGYIYDRDKTYSEFMRDIYTPAMATLQGPSYQYNPDQINQQFNQNVYDPSMQAWQENVAPWLRTQFSKTGSAVGTGMPRYLTRQAGQQANLLDIQRFGAQEAGREREFKAGESYEERKATLERDLTGQQADVLESAKQKDFESSEAYAERLAKVKISLGEQWTQIDQANLDRAEARLSDEKTAKQEAIDTAMGLAETPARIGFTNAQTDAIRNEIRLNNAFSGVKMDEALAGLDMARANTQAIYNSLSSHNPALKDKELIGNMYDLAQVQGMQGTQMAQELANIGKEIENAGMLMALGEGVERTAVQTLMTMSWQDFQNAVSNAGKGDPRDMIMQLLGISTFDNLVT
ncbi:MAG: hypothetical protein ABIG61_07320 [Planctomycetota bacterium]